jgi:hypothetical protein
VPVPGKNEANERKIESDCKRAEFRAEEDEILSHSNELFLSLTDQPLFLCLPPDSKKK